MVSYALLTHGVVFVTGFGIGAVVGRHVGDEDVNITQTQFRRAIAIVVTSTWVVAVGSDIAIATYDVPVLLHGIMGAVSGYLFSDDGLDITIGN